MSEGKEDQSMAKRANGECGARDLTNSSVQDLEERTVQLPENERFLHDKVVQLERDLDMENMKVKALELELKEERLKSREQIKETINEVIANFEAKILELITKSDEKVDRLLAINGELVENNTRQANQENDMVCFETQMMKKMDRVMKTLERQLPESVCLAEENDDVSTK